MTIAELLVMSRQAHSEYQQNQTRMSRQGTSVVLVDGQPFDAGEALQRAYVRRQQAHDLDPSKADAAWQVEPPRFNDAELIAFYESQLGRQ